MTRQVDICAVVNERLDRDFGLALPCVCHEALIHNRFHFSCRCVAIARVELRWAQARC